MHNFPLVGAVKFGMLGAVLVVPVVGLVGFVGLVGVVGLVVPESSPPPQATIPKQMKQISTTFFIL